MSTDRSHGSARQRRAASRWLSLALITLLSVPPAAFAAPWGTVRARSLGAHPVATLPAPFASVVVNSTGDGDKLTAVDAPAAGI